MGVRGLFFTSNENIIQITIYSDAKLKEKGGEATVRNYYLEKKLNIPNKIFSIQKKLNYEDKRINMMYYEKELLKMFPIDNYLDLKKKKYKISNDIKCIYAIWYNNNDKRINELNRKVQIYGPKKKVETVVWDWNMDHENICLYIGKSNDLKKRLSQHLLLGTKSLYKKIEHRLYKKTTSCQVRSGFEYLYLEKRKNVNLFDEMNKRLEVSFVEEESFLKRFYIEDYFIGKWRPWFNLDSER